jgi:hypothetical protein
LFVAQPRLAAANSAAAGSQASAAGTLALPVPNVSTARIEFNAGSIGMLPTLSQQPLSLQGVNIYKELKTQAVKGVSSDSPALELARQLTAHPEALQDPQVQTLLPAADLTRIQVAAQKLQEEARHDARIAHWLYSARREPSQLLEKVSPIVNARIAELKKAFAAPQENASAVPIALSGKKSLSSVLARFAPAKAKEQTLPKKGFWPFKKFWTSKGKSSSGGGVSAFKTSAQTHRPAPNRHTFAGRARHAMHNIAMGALMAVNMLNVTPAQLQQFSTDPLLDTAHIAQVAPDIAQRLARDPAAMAETMLAKADQKVEQGQYMKVQNVQDLIARYKKDVQLYVMGDLGLGKEELKSLADFLADKHWVVVLVEDSDYGSNEYTDNSGGRHYGDDAIEYGMHQGVFRRNDFQSFINPQTGKADGSILTIIMNQHVLLLRNSKTQDELGLNAEREFNGNLDQWAKDNLRSGGNIDGAVRDTVENIDRLMADAIARTVESAQAQLSEAREALAELESLRPGFAKNHPQAEASMGRLDLGSLKNDLAKADNALAHKDYGTAKDLADSVARLAAQRVRAIHDFQQASFSATQSIDSAKASIAALADAAKEFRSAPGHSGLTGDIANPDLQDMKAQLGKAEKLLQTQPSAAEASAQNVGSQAQDALSQLTQYPSGEVQIAAQEARLKGLQANSRASEAAQALSSARAELGEARSQWSTGSQWAHSLSTAKTSLSRADYIIAAAEAAALQNQLIAGVLSTLAALLTFGTSFWLHRKVKPVRAKAVERFNELTQVFNLALDQMIDKLDQTFMDFDLRAERFKGRTAELVVQAREDTGNLHILMGMAKNTLEKVRKFMWNPWVWLYRFLFPNRDQAALKQMDSEKLTFDPKDEKNLKKIVGWKDDVLGNISTYEPFKYSFSELQAQFDKLSVRALNNTELLKNSLLQSGPTIKSIEKSLSELAGQKASLEAEDGLFLLPSVFNAVLPEAQKTADLAKAAITYDPVGAIQGPSSEAQRLLREAFSLIGIVLQARKALLPTIHEIAGKLKVAGISSEWLDNGLTKLSGNAEALAAQTAQESTEKGIAAFGQDLAAWGSQAAQASDLTQRWLDAKANAIDKARTVIEAARIAIGGKLGLSPEKVLVEKDADPSALIEEADKKAKFAQYTLGNGDLAEAATALEELAALSVSAKAIVDATQASVNSHEQTVAARNEQAGKLDGLVPAHQAIIEALAQKYAPSVMLLSSGDPSHNGADGTVDNNIQETLKHIQDSKDKTQKAAAAFREGKVLEAANLLSQAAAHQEFAGLRLNEIQEKKARLEKTEAVNAQNLTTLDQRVNGYEKEVTADMRTMQPTLRAFEEAKKGLEKARKAVQTAKGDPFQAEALLAATAAALDQMWVQARNDRDAYAEAERSLKAADHAIVEAEKDAASAKNDQIADSSAIQSAYKTIAGLRKEYESIADGIRSAHSDWNALDHEADNITAKAAQAEAVLHGELVAADTACKDIEKAAKKVREATNWTGSYGVYISGSPGSGSLQSARSALSSGNYKSASDYADSALKAAKEAISDAEAEVSRLHAAELARQRAAQAAADAAAAAARRALSNSNSNSGFGGGGFGSSGGGSSGWSGGSSGGGRSSW